MTGPATDNTDLRWMEQALSLARRGLGRVWPNPAVGCVLVRDGRAVGRGWTAPGGRPHAERLALDQAGSRAAGATAYVTLEPCAHRGRTPPCADALIEAGVARVVFALRDPDPRVDGAGARRLRQAGIAVREGVCAGTAAALNAGFLCRIRHGRPHFTLKLATSLDARVATRTGESRWVTGPAARRHGHRLRAESDAIMVGIGTVLADDPALTCRLPGLDGHSPTRIVCDSRLRLPPDRLLVRTAKAVPLLILASVGMNAAAAGRLQDCGARIERVASGPDGRLDPAALGQVLGRLGFTRVLIESGGELATAFIRAGLIDRLVWYRAPLLLGDDGRPAIRDLGLERLADGAGFRRTGTRYLGEDLMETYARRERDEPCLPES